MDVQVGDILENEKAPSLREQEIFGSALRHGF